jgi:hypothetical protein
MLLGRWMLTTLAIGLGPALAYSQQLPELPPPRPVAPAPAPAPPPRALALAKIAAETNLWAPCCEPPGATKGLWCSPRPCAHSCSWQEWLMSYRDFLAWCYTRPTCCCGMRPAADASLWDWMTQWLPHGNGAATCPTSR